MSKEKKKSAWKTVGKILTAIFVVLCLVVIFFNVTHEYHAVDGQSMYPTLNDSGSNEDGVFVSKIKGWGRGDIVVAKSKSEQTGKDIMVIKRIIALGGDKICIKMHEGSVRIFIIYSGQQEAILLEEPYLSGYGVNDGLDTRFYKMAQNFALEVDSENFVTIPEQKVFYLGDNRKSSNDCSHENYGPRDASLIVGKVDYIIYGNNNLYWQVIKQFFGF